MGKTCQKLIYKSHKKPRNKFVLMYNHIRIIGIYAVKRGLAFSARLVLLVLKRTSGIGLFKYISNPDANTNVRFE